MPGCAVEGCKNSSRQNVKMNRLPRDSIRRTKWITNCETLGGMKNWSPLDTAALCEVGFFNFNQDILTFIVERIVPRKIAQDSRLGGFD
ncbi:PREDICTED: uncharacterized protein LOC105556389 [Vollenhovia emeryi]|uniref:uncharacterized protein LOC105556389 n=1 Tax=Vollenhovia emeryi TaxID=411798 RepID=UPI0005F47016|nr:PREDICTED: uncharacterized protein LOC105556389 [Vollenhovia emeryi]